MTPQNSLVLLKETRALILFRKRISAEILLLWSYICLGVNVITIIVSVINTLIQKKKVSSIKVNGETIEIKNVSQDLIEKVLNAKLQLTESNNDTN